MIWIFFYKNSKYTYRSISFIEEIFLFIEAGKKLACFVINGKYWLWTKHLIGITEIEIFIKAIQKSYRNTTGPSSFMRFMFYHLRRSNSMEVKVPGIAIILPKFNIVNRFRHNNNKFTKDRCSIPMDMTVVLSLHKFSLQATIDHHVPSVYSGHYAASINFCKNILLQRQQNYGVWNDWYQKLLYCLCGNV